MSKTLNKPLTSRQADLLLRVGAVHSEEVYALNESDLHTARYLHKVELIVIHDNELSARITLEGKAHLAARGLKQPAVNDTTVEYLKKFPSLPTIVRPRIQPFDVLSIIIDKMKEVVPMAMEPLIALGMMRMLDADDMNIRGKQVVAAYLDFCNGNAAHLAAVLAARSDSLVKFLNDHPGLQDCPKAVKAGASHGDGRK